MRWLRDNSEPANINAAAENINAFQMQMNYLQPFTFWMIVYCHVPNKTTATLNEFLQFTNNLEIPQLTEDMRDKIEGPLTYEECKEALSSFSNWDKSPGEDGFTTEFYIKFFDILGEHLIR